MTGATNMSDSRGPAPGFKRHPAHRVAIHPAGARWQVQSPDGLLADSRGALIVGESGHAPAVYFPRADVRMKRLTPTVSKSTCPFKGSASYWRLASSDNARHVAWSYPETYDEVTAIAGFIAFYADRVTISEIKDN